MTVKVRPARAGDAERCVELLSILRGTFGANATGQEDPRIAATFTSLLDGSRGEVLVADEQGQLLGMATVSYNVAMRYGGEYCQLEELIVVPEARGKNVGALLVEETVTRARERGCGEYGLYLVDATEHNLPFYQKFGFVKVESELRQPLRAHSQQETER